MRPIDADVFVINVVKSGFGAEFINRVTGLLIDTPTIELRQGEWIHDRLEADGAKLPDLFLPLCQCSECSIYVQYESNYCPNCGARMKGANDEVLRQL